MPCRVQSPKAMQSKRHLSSRVTAAYLPCCCTERSTGIQSTVNKKSCAEQAASVQICSQVKSWSCIKARAAKIINKRTGGTEADNAGSSPALPAFTSRNTTKRTTQLLAQLADEIHASFSTRWKEEGGKIIWEQCAG